MQLPTPLLRTKKNTHKNTFGHVLIIAGSARMLGAGALCSLSAMRSGAGLVTLAVPKSLNTTAQKKISNEIMTWPLPETKNQTFSASAFKMIKQNYSKYDAIAIGPGLSQNLQTQKLINKIIETSPVSLVVDADALNVLSRNIDILNKTQTPKILTPHPGEMLKLLNQKQKIKDDKRREITEKFIRKYPSVTLLLKGHKTVVAQSKKRTYINTTGNAGMATAGSGDVLTGMIAAFLAQGLNPFDAAKFGAYLHGKAGDLAAAQKTKTSMIATDIIDCIGEAIT